MKQALMLLYFLVISGALVAQSVTVKGKLVSESDKNELPYATVSVAEEAAPTHSIKKMATKQMVLSQPRFPPEHTSSASITWE